MHSGGISGFFSPGDRARGSIAKKILDGVCRIWHNAGMEKFIRSVQMESGSFRLVIPKKIVLRKRWGGVKYVLVEDTSEDYIIIRRLIDEKALKG